MSSHMVTIHVLDEGLLDHAFYVGCDPTKKAARTAPGVSLLV
mgnify:FL=1|jgi:hypothetical protein